MSNPNSGAPQQPGSTSPQGITQEYVAQLVVAFMQLYACILALPGGYEALQAAQEIITSDAKRSANSIVFPFWQTRADHRAKQKAAMQAAYSQGSQAGAIDRPHPAAILSHPAAHLKPAPPQGTVNGYHSP